MEEPHRRLFQHHNHHHVYDHIHHVYDHIHDHSRSVFARSLSTSMLACDHDYERPRNHDDRISDYDELACLLAAHPSLPTGCRLVQPTLRRTL